MLYCKIRHKCKNRHHTNFPPYNQDPGVREIVQIVIREITVWGIVQLYDHVIELHSRYPILENSIIDHIVASLLS